MQVKGINIFSGEKGLGGALTNPTELSKLKGSIDKSYPVTFQNKRYPDTETAYKNLKGENSEENDLLMVRLIHQKFKEYPELFAEITSRGGSAFIKACSHFTYAKSAGFQSWEGQGLESRFIRVLLKAYETYQENNLEDSTGQVSLF